MPVIKPFKAFRYNQSFFSKMSGLICPPYDIISPEGNKKLLKKNSFNVVRLELPGHVHTPRQYVQAAAYFKKWIKEGILKREQKKSLYVYEQRFAAEGKTYCRRGFLLQ